MHDVQAVAPPACPHCGGALRPGARFCATCGQTLLASGAIVEAAAPLARPSQRALLAMHIGELKRIAWLFGLLLLGSLLLGMLARFDDSPWPETVIAGIDAVLVLAFAASVRHELLPRLQLPALSARAALQMVGVSLGAMAVMSAYFALIASAGVPMLDSAHDDLQAGWPVWSIFLMGSIMPAVFEELAFRGVIQGSLERIFRGPEPWLIQAALFGVMHLLPITFVSHTVMGLWFGWLRNRSQSLYPGMLAHAGWNALVLAQELYTG